MKKILFLAIIALLLTFTACSEPSIIDSVENIIDITEDYSANDDEINQYKIEDTEESDTVSSSNEPEWREFLNDYEAWVDSYIEITKKYTENPSDFSILSEYLEMMNELAEWSEKADEIELELEDTNEALEYSAELLKIAAKLAEAAY